MSTTPLTLLERLRTSSDPAAWRRFVELYTPLLFAWARRLGLREAEAADLVQDVFLHLLNKLPAFVYDRKQSFRGWLKTVAHNLWRNSRQRRSRAATGAIDLDALPGREAEAFWEADYRQFLVDRALAVMKTDFEPATWQACWEFVVNGRSAEDVAGALGITAEAVRAAKYRVINRLRRELAGLLD